MQWKISRWLGIVVALSLLSGCRWLSPKTPKTAAISSPGQLVKHQSLPSFTNLTVDGYATVELTQGSPQVTLIGSERAMGCYQVKVQNQTLSLTNRCHLTPAHLRINLTVPQLTKITATEHAQITAHNLTTAPLTILAQDASQLTLEGRYPVTHIQQRGKSHLRIHWVDSPDLQIDAADNSQIWLAGRVAQLRAKLHNQARLNARYLRAQTVTMATTDQAWAEILPITKLEAHATQASNIGYFKKPVQLLRTTQETANILQIGYLE